MESSNAHGDQKWFTYKWTHWAHIHIGLNVFALVNNVDRYV